MGWKVWAGGFVAFMAFIMIAGEAGLEREARKAEEAVQKTNKEAARRAALTPEERAKEDQANNARTARYACKLALPKAAHDPSSVDPGDYASWPVAWNKTGDAATVKATFRAKNQFGALVLSSASCEVAVLGDSVVVKGVKPD